MFQTSLLEKKHSFLTADDVKTMALSSAICWWQGDQVYLPRTSLSAGS